MAKVTELSNSTGLMVTVGIEEWKGGILSLINSAEAKGIIPDAIVLTRVDQTGEDDKISIILWGDK